MEEIKVGEYIRTKEGVIAKVTYVDVMMVDCDRDVFDLNNLAMMEIPIEYIEEYIAKHSSNIIDLIEEGDYVNGMEVIKIGSEHREIKVLYYNGYYTDNLTLTEAEINSIVTNQQFEQMKYIVGDE